MADNNKVTLQSSDGKIYIVDTAVASLSKLLDMAINADERLRESESERKTITVKNVSGKILGLVIDYCRYHVLVTPDTPAATVRKWDLEFVQPLLEDDKYALIELLKAARYLDIHSLLDFICECIADKIKGKSVQSIREMLNIQNQNSGEEAKRSKS
jgi:S-phase kinase-associated protein 1